MDTEHSQPGAEPGSHLTTEPHSVNATSKTSPANIHHGMLSTVPAQSYHKETGKFRLFSLPLELRQEIYRHYFNHTRPKCNLLPMLYQPIEADKICHIYCLRKCRSRILIVSRQVYSEARDVLYSDTTWYIEIKFLHYGANPEIASDACLRAFRTRPEFRFIQNITVHVTFHTTNETSVWTSDDCNRLEISRKLLNLICETLLQAPNLLKLRLFWHDRIEHGDWEEKRDCLSALARLPETVKCAVFMGAELAKVKFPRRSLSAQEQAAKADLNRHLKTVREQYQARFPRKSLDGLENTS